MNRQRTSFTMSLLLHGVLLSSLYAVSTTCARMTPPMVIDFSVASGKGPDAAPGAPAAGPPSPKPAPRPRIAPQPARPVAQTVQRHDPLPVREQAPKPALEQAGPVAVAARPVAETAVVAKYEPSPATGSASGTASPSGQGGTGKTHGGGGSGTGTGGGGDGSGPPGGVGPSAEQLRNRYLREHFAYIKDLIQRNITYPSRARKMGWAGRVVVSFIVHESGRVSNEKVVSSSGYELLDGNVISTVRDVAPFPKPPVKAELRVPIVYRLE